MNKSVLIAIAVVAVVIAIVVGFKVLGSGGEDKTADGPEAMTPQERAVLQGGQGAGAATPARAGAGGG